MEQLNEAQQSAVTASDTHVLVLAGAGSGKTRVLTHRIAWLLQEQHCEAHNILAVTFTNKAALEVKKRIQHLIHAGPAPSWIGTFHGMCHRLLRLHHQAANLPHDFRILDTDDQLRLVKKILKELSIDDNRLPPKEALNWINRHKEEGLRYTHLPPPRDPYARYFYAVYEAYERHLTHLGGVDFAELLLRTLELFAQHNDLLTHYQNRWHHVLIDEFQDTNRLQYRWLQQLATHHLFLVGDDDQSIYGWRGARSEHLREFTQRHPQARLIKLEQNYRSTGHILQASNAVIAHNPDRLGKALWTQGHAGQLIARFSAISDLEEAQFVAKRMAHLHQRSHTSWSRFAVLYRSNAQSRLLEEALLVARVPYRIYGGLRFFDRAEIKDALAYLRLVHNPHDDPAFDRIINWPQRGLGEQTIARIRHVAQTQGLSMWDAAHIWRQDADCAKRASHALTSFVTLIESCREHAQDPLPELLHHVVHASGLWTKFQGTPQERGEAKLDNLKELIAAAEEFTRNDDTEHPVDAFLAHAVLEGTAQQATDDMVQLMTIHAAKGLEFDTVFLVGVEEGLFPHPMALQSNTLDEERRLCYVAMTRAQRQLYITHADVRRVYGQTRYNTPSRFLREIPENLLYHVRTAHARIPEAAT